MRQITVAVANIHVDVNRQKNEEQMWNHLQALPAGVDLVVFPEAALQGYAPYPGRAAVEYYLKEGLVLDGEDVFLSRLHQHSIDNGRTIVFGAVEAAPREGPDVLYDSAVILTPGGLRESYRKVHLATDEGFLFHAGNSFPVFVTPVGKVGLLICYDVCFPEAARSLALCGAEIIVCLNAWGYSHVMDPARVNDHSRVVLDRYAHVRAVENQCALVLANQCGVTSFEGQSIHFLGASSVIAPNGKTLEQAGEDETILLHTFDLDAALIEERLLNRNAMNLLRHRRPDTYSR